MLSLPEDWDYTTRGLASICKEGVDSVCATVRELEAAGYIIRRRIRDKNGQMRGMEYTVLEQPQPPEPRRQVAPGNRPGGRPGERGAHAGPLSLTMAWGGMPRTSSSAAMGKAPRPPMDMPQMP